MTHSETANVKLVSTARLPATVLLGLCNAAVTIPTTSVHNMREEDQEANGQDTTAPTLRGTSPRTRRTASAGGDSPASTDPDADDAVADQGNPQGSGR